MKSTRRLFLSRLFLGAVGFSPLALLPFAAQADQVAPQVFPRSAPEAQGVEASGVLNFVNAAEGKKLHLHSLVLVRHGKVVAEGWWAPYAPGLKHTLYSLSKSFNSTAVGLAVAEGRLHLDDKVISFFPQDVPATISPNLEAMRVKDLLMMGAGHQSDSLFGPNFSVSQENWVQSVLARPVQFPPGTHFTYNNGASFLLSAIVQKTTGQNVFTYLTPRLFAPLGIEGADWEVNPRGINTGAWGLHVKTEDIAKLGQLYLQKGMWNGQRILPEEWVNEATQAQIKNASGVNPEKDQASDWAQGYGYQFWRCLHGAFRGDGAFGQFCIVMPEQDAVLAMTSESNDLQGILNTVWTHLLPAMKAEKLPPDEKADAQLREKLTSLVLPFPVGEPASPVSTRINKAEYSVTDNSLGIQRVSMIFENGRCVFTLHDAKGEHHVAAGFGRWLEGETDLSPAPLFLATTANPEKSKIAASGAWSDENTLVLYWRFIETAHYESVTCHFDGDEVRVEFKKSASILSPGTKDNRPVLTGKLQK